LIVRGQNMSVRLGKLALLSCACILVSCACILVGYLAFSNSLGPHSGTVKADKGSAFVGQTGVTYITWDGAIALVVWKDFPSAC